MAAMFGEERHHLVDAELRLLEHFGFEIEQVLAAGEVERPQALQRVFERDRLQRPGQLRVAREAEEHVGIAERRIRRAARQHLVAENRPLLRPYDRLEKRRYALAADDVAQLAGELLLALLLGIAHRVAGRLHALINLPLQANLRPVIDARRADEKSDLSLLHRREPLPHRGDELLADVIRDRVERCLLPQVGAARFEENVEARSADEIRRDERLRKARARLDRDCLTGAAEELVEEGPAVLRLDRFELLDVDVDDANLALLDEHFFEPAEHHWDGWKSARPIEEHAL